MNIDECCYGCQPAMAQLAELRKSVAKADMECGRRDAKIAVLTSVLAKLAREGQAQYAQEMLKKSDLAWLNVKPEDLVRARVS